MCLMTEFDNSSESCDTPVNTGMKCQSSSSSLVTSSTDSTSNIYSSTTGSVVSSFSSGTGSTALPHYNISFIFADPTGKLAKNAKRQYESQVERC